MLSLGVLKRREEDSGNGGGKGPSANRKPDETVTGAFALRIKKV